MKGIGILLLLILLSALPAVIVFFLLRLKKSALTLPWFMLSLAAGIVSFLIAALIHDILIPGGNSSSWPVFFTVFIRIALVEETSRLATIIPFLKICKNPQHRDNAFGAALGLAAGLGFAFIETAYYGITNINLTVLRSFTAAPLHGACGIRAGTAVFTARHYPLKALFLFVSAVLIHGAYNLVLVSPFHPSFLAIIISLSSLFASLGHLRAADKGEEAIDKI